MFQGFPEETIRFFLDIRFHNEVPWFHAHRQEYEDFIRKPFAAFIDDMAPTMLSIAEDIDVRPNRCLARINRDIRFTRDKSPYRDHMWLLFRRAGEERKHSVMYWFELSPQEMVWGLGFWDANRPATDALRRRMAAKPREVQRVLKQCGLPGEPFNMRVSQYRNVKPPPNIPPALSALYPMREFYVDRRDVPLSACYTPELTRMVKEDFLRLKPLYLLLRQAADDGLAQLDP